MIKWFRSKRDLVKLLKVRELEIMDLTQANKVDRHNYEQSINQDKRVRDDLRHRIRVLESGEQLQHYRDEAEKAYTLLDDSEDRVMSLRKAIQKSEEKSEEIIERLTLEKATLLAAVQGMEVTHD